MSRSPDDHRYHQQVGACALSRWHGAVDRCRWCDATADGSGWCGHRCQDDYRRNHWWDHARAAAIVRDGNRCVRCRRGPETVTLAKLLLRALIPMGPVEAARLWRTPEWAQLSQSWALEVNHVVPRRGAGYHAGCHHHLQALETLCHGCHAVVTAEQQRLLGADPGTGLVPLADAG